MYAWKKKRDFQIFASKLSLPLISLLHKLIKLAWYCEIEMSPKGGERILNFGSLSFVLLASWESYSIKYIPVGEGKLVLITFEYVPCINALKYHVLPLLVGFE